MLMKHIEHGLHDAVGLEVEEMKKNGWVEYSYEKLMQDVEKKRNPPESVTIEPAREAVKGKPGRKPKTFSLGGTNGDSSNKD